MEIGEPIKQARSKQPRKVRYGDGGLTYLKDRGLWRKFYYVDEQTEDGIVRRKKSVSHADMTQAIVLAKEAVAANEKFWATLNEQRERFNQPELATPYHPDTLAIQVPTQRLDMLPTVVERYMNSRVKWRKDGTLRGIKSSTRKRYGSHIKSMQNPAYGSLASKPMRYLTSDLDVQPHFLNFLHSNDPDTALRYRGFLIGIGEYAEEANIWDRNLFKKLPAVEVEALTTSKRILTLDEVDRLYAAAQHPGFKRPKIRQSILGALRLLRLGLRPTEVFALSMHDIVDDETVAVNYAQSSIKPDWNTWADGAFVWLDDPKTPASMASVTVPNSFMVDVKESASRSDSDLVPCYDKPEGKHLRFLVPNLQGKAWLYNNARRMIEDLFEFADIDVAMVGGSNSRFLYCFRYTYASELVALGANDVELMALMRHRDANTSKSIYAEARKSDLNIYREYRRKIKVLADYNKTIAQMDEDRRKKVKPWK